MKFAFCILTASVLLVAPALAAQPASQSATLPAAYRGADLKLGAKLLAANQCAACHQKKVGGDGSAIYKPAGRINSPDKLITMVEQCSTQLNLSLFPEEITAVAAVLNRDHYHFR